MMKKFLLRKISQLLGDVDLKQIMDTIGQSTCCKAVFIKFISGKRLNEK